MKCYLLTLVSGEKIARVGVFRSLGELRKFLYNLIGKENITKLIHSDMESLTEDLFNNEQYTYFDIDSNNDRYVIEQINLY